MLGLQVCVPTASFLTAEPQTGALHTLDEYSVQLLGFYTQGDSRHVKANRFTMDKVRCCMPATPALDTRVPDQSG